jgi:hypothetical protein
VALAFDLRPSNVDVDQTCGVVPSACIGFLAALILRLQAIDLHFRRCLSGRENVDFRLHGRDAFELHIQVSAIFFDAIVDRREKRVGPNGDVASNAWSKSRRHSTAEREFTPPRVRAVLPTWLRRWT